MKDYEATILKKDGLIQKTTKFVNPTEQEFRAYFLKGRRWDRHKPLTVKVFAPNCLQALNFAKTVFPHHAWKPAYEYFVKTDNGKRLYISYILTEEEARMYDNKLWYEMGAELHLEPL